MKTWPHDYHEPRLLPSGALQTCRGIVIGGAIPPSAPEMTRDGVRIQGALLDPRTARAPRWWERLLAPLWRAC